MLDGCTSECMGTKNQRELWYRRNYMCGIMIITNQRMMFGEYVKMRESLYTQVITQVIAILNHINTIMVLIGYEDSSLSI